MGYIKARMIRHMAVIAVSVLCLTACGAAGSNYSDGENALEKGNKMVKLFPGEVFGPKYVKAVKAPIPHVEIMPTGGVSIDNVEEWFKMGVSCVGVGSSLLGAGSLEDIENLAKEFKNKIAKIRG